MLKNLERTWNTVFKGESALGGGDFREVYNNTYNEVIIHIAICPNCDTKKYYLRINRKKRDKIESYTRLKTWLFYSNRNLWGY